MTDDELLQLAGEAAREEDPLADARWDALPEGSLSERDRAELRALGERSDAARGAYEALQPLDEAERERLVDAILAPAKVGSPGTAAPTSGAEVIPIASRRRRAFGVIAAVVSIAAAVALAVQPHRGSSLPGYQASLLGEQAQRSGDATGANRIGPGSRLELVLRPEIPAEGPVVARGFLVQGGVTRAWNAPLEIAEGGAIRITGSYESLFVGVPAGPCELLVAVGRPGSIPETPEAVAAAHAGRVGSRDDTWHLVRVPLLLVDRERSVAPPGP